MLNKLQIKMLLTSTHLKRKKDVDLMSDWTIRAIVRLERYLEHRKILQFGYKFCGEAS